MSGVVGKLLGAIYDVENGRHVNYRDDIIANQNKKECAETMRKAIEEIKRLRKLANKRLHEYPPVVEREWWDTLGCED